MAGLTGITTNNVPSGSGRDWHIFGDKHFRGGKHSWHHSAPSDFLERKSPPEIAGVRRAAPSGAAAARTGKAPNTASRKLQLVERWKTAHDPLWIPAHGQDARTAFDRWGDGCHIASKEELSDDRRRRKSPPLGASRRRSAFASRHAAAHGISEAAAATEYGRAADSSGAVARLNASSASAPQLSGPSKPTGPRWDALQPPSPPPRWPKAPPMQGGTHL
eukprot:TRINITY_DN34692_c0_g1_i1.p1 TRINITY_DN34692_c0_g1~~TRINITY_DN34692_c0_g1_i1.p1  ORF type:complete len:235 (+),score=41.98 TRINITY_DN34692_c0_g1_i1:51-707(+)